MRSVNSNPSPSAAFHPFLSDSVTSSGAPSTKTDKMDTDAVTQCSGSLVAEESAKNETAATTELAQPGESNGKSSALLELPAELRNRIYEEVFQENVVDLTEACRRRTKAEPRAVDHPLSLVCRQIRAEARGLFFSLSTFTMRISLRALHILEPSSIGLITKIDIKSSQSRPWPLRSLTFERLHQIADIAQLELLDICETEKRNYPQLSPALRLRSSFVLPAGDIVYAESPLFACYELFKSPNFRLSFHYAISEQSRQWAVSKIEQQIGFFKYDHQDYKTCYYQFGYGVCDCPKKGERLKSCLMSTKNHSRGPKTRCRQRIGYGAERGLM